MSQIAKLFTNARRQAARLPAADASPLRRPDNWDSFFAALKGLEVPADFLSEEERQQMVLSAISLRGGANEALYARYQYRELSGQE